MLDIAVLEVDLWLDHDASGRGIILYTPMNLDIEPSTKGGIIKNHYKMFGIWEQPSCRN